MLIRFKGNVTLEEDISADYSGLNALLISYLYRCTDAIRLVHLDHLLFILLV